MKLNIQNETSRLRAVILGTAKNNGGIPTVEDCYDPKSIEHVLAGTYPKEEDMIFEMSSVEKVLQKHGVVVYRPNVIDNYNQIFSRDIAFVIDDKFIKSNILPDREREFLAIDKVIHQIDKENIITLPKACHVEGGDVIIHNEFLNLLLRY